MQSSTLEIADKTAALSGGRDIQQLDTLYERFKRELLNPDNSADHSFDLLQELHLGLQRNADLKKIFWKVRICAFSIYVEPKSKPCTVGFVHHATVHPSAEDRGDGFQTRRLTAKKSQTQEKGWFQVSAFGTRPVCSKAFKKTLGQD